MIFTMKHDFMINKLLSTVQRSNLIT